MQNNRLDIDLKIKLESIMVQGFIFLFLLLKRIRRQQVASQLVFANDIELRNRLRKTFGTKEKSKSRISQVLKSVI